VGARLDKDFTSTKYLLLRGKKMKKILSIILSATLGLGIMAGCVSETATPTTQPTGAPSASGEKVDTVYIGMANPLTGANADAGTQDLYAAQLAVKHINAKGGIKSLGGAKVELVVIDTTSDSTQIAQIVEREISGNKLSGIVGTGFSGLTLPMLPIIEKYGIPTVTNSINDKITTSDYDFIFQAVPKGSSFGQTQVDYIKYLIDEKGIDIKKVAIVYENSS
jgi:branched-chain amino acid transport system substrate-binding protein